MGTYDLTKSLICALSLVVGPFAPLHAQDLKPAGKEPKLTVGGLLQAQGEFGDQGDSRFTKNDRFLLRRARLNAQGSFLENFDFKVELDLGGTTTALRAQMTDGYVQWSAAKTFNVRMGQFKTPYGYEQLVQDPTMFTIERSLPNDRLTLGRQLGLQLSANTVDKRVTAAAGLFNGNGVNNGLNDNESFVYVARLAAIPVQTKYADQPHATRDHNGHHPSGETHACLLEMRRVGEALKDHLRADEDLVLPFAEAGDVAMLDIDLQFDVVGLDVAVQADEPGLRGVVGGVDVGVEVLILQDGLGLVPGEIAGRLGVPADGREGGGGDVVHRPVPRPEDLRPEVKRPKVELRVQTHAAPLAGEQVVLRAAGDGVEPEVTQGQDRVLRGVGVEPGGPFDLLPGDLPLRLALPVALRGGDTAPPVTSATHDEQRRYPEEGGEPSERLHFHL